MASGIGLSYSNANIGLLGRAWVEEKGLLLAAVLSCVTVTASLLRRFCLRVRAKSTGRIRLRTNESNKETAEREKSKRGFACQKKSWYGPKSKM